MDLNYEDVPKKYLLEAMMGFVLSWYFITFLNREIPGSSLTRCIHSHIRVGTTCGIFFFDGELDTKVSLVRQKNQVYSENFFFSR